MRVEMRDGKFVGRKSHPIVRNIMKLDDGGWGYFSTARVMTVELFCV